MKENKKIKVLMVEQHSPGNRYVLELARELKHYCDLTIYCNKKTDFKEEGVCWLPRFYDGGKGKAGAILDYGRTLLDLGSLIKKSHVDVLHIQSFKKADVEMKLYRTLRRYYGKLVMTVHNVLPHEPCEGDLALYGGFYRDCDLLIVHNDASKQELQDKFQIPDEKIAVIPRGLYTTYNIDPDARDDDPRRHFLCFGRIRPYKGVDILLKAISLMPEEERDKCLFIIRGEQYPKLDPTDYRALIRDYGISDCVEFSNERVPEEEIPSLMGNADALLFPYRKIYGSGVLLMAYTYEVPVIASDVPTFVEGTNQGQAGVLFKSEDPEDLMRAILEAMTWDQEKIDSCRQAIRRIVDERHSWKVTAKSTVEAYQCSGERPDDSVPDGEPAELASSPAQTEKPTPHEVREVSSLPMDSLELLLKESADARYEQFLQWGHAAPGNNGPYGSKDTPVRNTGHWLIIYAYLWKRTGYYHYRKIAEIFAKYLLSIQSRSQSGAIPCMEEGGQDSLNGLIGQAWTIEALVYAYQTLGHKKYLRCAIQIFKSQKFDYRTGFWKRVEPDGKILDYDMTLNHQVWFGMSGRMILSCIEDRRIREQVERHFDRVHKEYFGIHADGLIRHFGAMKRLRKSFLALYTKQYIKYAGLTTGLLKEDKVDIMKQEQGYHVFELYGYARLAMLDPDYPLFRTKAFSKALRYGMRMGTLNRKLGIDDPDTMNRYAYGYNSPAFEWPLVQLIFRKKTDKDKVTSLLKIQKKLTYNEKTKMFDRHTDDPETLTARLYEYVYYLENLERNNQAD